MSGRLVKPEIEYRIEIFRVIKVEHVKVDKRIWTYEFTKKKIQLLHAGSLLGVCDAFQRTGHRN